MGMLGQCVRKTKKASRLVKVQNRQNLMIPEPRSLNLFTRKPPRSVPPPPAGTTRYPEEGTQKFTLARTHCFLDTD
uniref:Uncharacterized protein n=1 Tax=Peromyscus maniculatus bairdii TaxID=230844 RepID=A0A8C8UF40_PERMB